MPMRDAFIYCWYRRLMHLYVVCGHCPVRSNALMQQICNESSYAQECLVTICGPVMHDVQLSTHLLQGTIMINSYEMSVRELA
jgi:hypothetical protein